MLIQFFLNLRSHGISVTLQEHLCLLHALENNLADCSIETFYYLVRVICVKDEQLYDRYDLAFANYWDGKISDVNSVTKQLPKEWLRKQMEQVLSEDEKNKIRKMPTYDELMQALEERLKTQKSRHQGGNHWIGTGGTSPFGAYGYHPEGIRIGQTNSRHQRAVKVWDKRSFRNLSLDQGLSDNSFSSALQKLRDFSRQGECNELNLVDTIQATAKQGGQLELVLQPEKQNKLRCLLLLDIGGSMDEYVYLVEKLFRAAKSSFKSIDMYYFHNCIYESVWQDNQKRETTRLDTNKLLKKFPSFTKVIVVGDACMSPYELLLAGASVEHNNDEPGQLWLKRIVNHFDKCVWINPMPLTHWYADSVGIVRDIFKRKMYQLTVEGITHAMSSLR